MKTWNYCLIFFIPIGKSVTFLIPTSTDTIHKLARTGKKYVRYFSDALQYNDRKNWKNVGGKALHRCSSHSGIWRGHKEGMQSVGTKQLFGIAW